MVEFNDAQATARDYPETFEAPELGQLAGLQPGDRVQVCGDDCERFWTRITKVEGETIEATVSNTLVMVPLEFGETVTFEKRHIYQVAPR